MINNLKYSIIKKYNKQWPSDHPIIINQEHKTASWNILSQKTGKISTIIDNISYHETNNSFSSRLNLVIEILILLDKYQIDIIALQEVDLLGCIKITNSILSNSYLILFCSDPYKPKGQLLLIRNHQIKNVSKEIKVIKKYNTITNDLHDLYDLNESNNLKNKIDTDLFVYDNQYFHFENCNRYYHTTLSCYIEDIKDTDELITTQKTTSMNIIVYDEYLKKTKLITTVHLKKYNDYYLNGDKYGMLYNNIDKEEYDVSYIIGDFNDNLDNKKTNHRPHWDFVIYNNTILDTLRIFPEYIYDTNSQINNLVIQKLITGYYYQNQDIKDILLTDSYRYEYNYLKADILNTFPELIYDITNTHPRHIENKNDYLRFQELYREGNFIFKKESDKMDLILIFDKYIPNELLLNLLIGYDNPFNKKSQLDKDLSNYKIYQTKIWNIIGNQYRTLINIDLYHYFKNGYNIGRVIKIIRYYQTLLLSDKIDKLKDKNNWIHLNISKFKTVFRCFLDKNNTNMYILKKEFINHYHTIKMEKYYFDKYGNNSYNRLLKIKL